jgi:hypothetical protein
MAVRVALIHAVPLAMPPVHAAFERHWPEAERFNVLDDSLAPDREREADLTAGLRERIRALSSYAFRAGAAGVLFTCSAFGEAIEAARAGRRETVLKPNEAMFANAARAGRRVGLLATFAPAVASMAAEFRHAHPGIALTTCCVPGAMACLKRGAPAEHDRLLAEAAAAQLARCDVVMLAHFSTARAHAAVSAAVGATVLSAPASAVVALRAALDPDADQK